MSETDTPIAAPPSARRVSFWLGVGILFVPLVFAWLTLRQGYGQAVRRFAFGWLVALYLFVIVQQLFFPQPKISTAVETTRSEEPKVPPPTGFGPVSWGARPSHVLRRVTDRVYAPRSRILPLYLGLRPAEEDYEFDDHKLFGASLYFDGERTHAELQAGLAKIYGPPQSVDDATSQQTWDWKRENITMDLSYQPSHQRSTLHIEQGRMTSEELAALPQKRLDIAVADAKSLKQQLRDPSSAQWAKVETNFDGGVVCILLRARNGFGGMNVDTYTFYKDNTRVSQSSNDWRRYCETAPMFDYTNEVQSLMSWE